MICEANNCVFVHIPKTGGQSISQFFLNLNGLEWKHRSQFGLKFNKDPSRGPRRLAHLTAYEYLTLGYLDRNNSDRMFKFAFVRNPWDRLVSEYEFRMGIRRRMRKETVDFKTFIFKEFPVEGRSDAYRHALPQCRFVFDSSGRQLVDFIGRFETLQKDFNHVCERLQIGRSELPHKNKSRMKTKFYEEYYDSESIEFVEQYYKDDLFLFKYKFGGEV
jgi:Sulfotransferase family